MFDEFFQGRDWLLADGATGTNLFDMGLTSGEAPELWNERHPDRVRRLHQSFVDAGADIILTNSFGANARRLALHGAQGWVYELNRLAAEHARAVADAAGRRVIVAGSVGPTGDLFAPLGALTEAEAVEVFAEQMEGLKAGGADLIWIETMSAREEMRAAAAAAGRVGMPYTVTASFDTAGNTMMGVTPEAMAGDVKAFRPPPHGIGCNCGVGASDLLCSVLAMTATAPDATVIAKANCGIPQVGAAGVIYSGTPEIMAAYARLARDAGARIIGGCCGTRPEHLRAMRRALETHPRGQRPSVERIIAEVGALASPPARAGGGPRGPGPGRGRTARGRAAPGMSAPPRVLILACGALAREILALLPPERFPHITLHCLPATLHNRPDRIAPALRAALAERAGAYDRVFIGYADCGSGGAVDEVAAEFGATRLPGAHCYAFFSGVAEFTRREEADLGSFYLTDFLARHFETLVWEGLGLNRHPDLRELYFGNYRRVVYLAQTEDAALTEAAQAAAARLGLAFERRDVGYGDLATALAAIR